MIPTETPPPRQHLTITARRPDPEITQLRSIVSDALLVDDRCDLEQVLCDLLAASPSTSRRTLDLVGHATADRSLLQLGDWVIDGTNPTVLAFFRELDEQDVLRRLAVDKVRLLGSNTAGTEDGRNTLSTLAQILGVEVTGTVGPIFATSFDQHGFCGSHLHNPADLASTRCADIAGARYPRAFDLDAVDAVTGKRPAWPRHFVDADAAPGILRLVKRSEGVVMPALLARPECELAFPAGQPGTYHVAQVLLDHQLVRVHYDGVPVGFSISDRLSLRARIAELAAV